MREAIGRAREDVLTSLFRTLGLVLVALLLAYSLLAISVASVLWLLLQLLHKKELGDDLFLVIKEFTIFGFSQED